MRNMVRLLGLLGLVFAYNTPAVADERAEWGIAVSVGADAGSNSMLLENDGGYHLIVVDPTARIVGAGMGPMTYSDIRPGDRIDYAVATWSGMDIADVLYVTPMRHAELAR
jgi:hypothetical protein